MKPKKSLFFNFFIKFPSLCDLEKAIESRESIIQDSRIQRRVPAFFKKSLESIPTSSYRKPSLSSLNSKNLS